MDNEYVHRILTARVYEAAVQTPLDHAPNLSRRCNNRIYLKREDLQPIFSFKLRGAFNRIAHLTAEERERGVIAASAGNHAQGVAFGARRFGCSAVIVMPRTTPLIKIQAVQNLGGEVVLSGDSYSDAAQFAYSEAARTGRVVIHPFDDPYVIAGQGTVGLELTRQMPPDTAAIFVPIGGGGLAAGVSVLFKQLYPQVKIIGVEPVDAATMHASLAAGQPVPLKDVGVFCDGVAVKQAGSETFRLCSRYLDEIVLVDVDAVCAAIKDIFEDTRSISEPSGALALAGLKAYIDREGCSDQSLIAVSSGANMNFNRLRHIAERTELGEGREMLLAVSIPERPGSFKEFIRVLGDRNVTEFNYRYAGPPDAHVYVGIEIAKKSAREEIVDRFTRHGFSALDLTDSEVAKLHIRYLVGGRSQHVDNERLFRFEFPERPGALMRFLDVLKPNWNISLFHYRNHGADVGRVLAGIQVPPDEAAEFDKFLQDLHYGYVEETDSAACKLFL